MIQAIKLAEYSLLVAIATSFLKKPIQLGSFEVKLSIFFFVSFAISVIFLLIAIYKKQVSFSIPRGISLVIILSIFSIIFGTLVSFLIYKKLPLLIILNEYAHIATCFIIFLELIIISGNNPRFLNKILPVFLVSLSVIPLFYLLTNYSVSQYLMYRSVRFNGFLNDPNHYGTFQIIPTLLLLFFIITKRQKILWLVLLSLLFCLSVGTILWSGSRSGLLGLVASFFIILFLTIGRLPIKKIIFATILIIISFPVGYLILPQSTHTDINARIAQTVNTISANNLNSPSSLNVNAIQDRLTIWSSSFDFIKYNPFGYGPGYYKIVNIISDDKDYPDHRVAHNFELAILLNGGILLFFLLNTSLFLLIYRPLRSFYFRKFGETHVLIAILAGLLISSLFHDFLFLEWIWIIAALILAQHQQLSLEKSLPPSDV